jgi:molybdate transport system permease protein
MNQTSIVALSLEVAVGGTLFALPFAVWAAWLLSRVEFHGKWLFDALVNAPLVLPPVVIGYLLLLTFGARTPIGAWLLHVLHLQLIFTTWGAMLAASVMGLPLMVRGIRLSFDSVDGRLETAARTLGATPLDVLRSITLPLILPGILSGCLLGFARALGEFGATITFAGNIEGQTRTLPLAIYTALNSPDSDQQVHQLVAMSLLLACIAIVIASQLERRVRSYIGQSHA